MNSDKFNRRLDLQLLSNFEKESSFQAMNEGDEEGEGDDEDEDEGNEDDDDCCNQLYSVPNCSKKFCLLRKKGGTRRVFVVFTLPSLRPYLLIPLHIKILNFDSEK